MYTPMSAQTLERRLNRAMSGDYDALEKLVDEVNTMSRISNRRMSDLRKQGLDLSVYNRAKESARELGYENFRKWTAESAAENPEDFVFQARETRMFLWRKESTVSGAKERLDRMLDIMEEQNWIDKDTISPEESKTLAKLMSMGGLSQLISAIYSSEEEEDMQDLFNDITNQLKTEDYDTISKTIQNLIQGTRDYDDLYGIL